MDEYWQNWQPSRTVTDEEKSSQKLVPFRYGATERGAGRVHSFAPEGSSLDVKVRPEYIINMRRLMMNLKLPHPHDGIFLWIPAWVPPAIRLFMDERLGTGLTVHDFLAQIASGRSELR